MEWVKKEEPYRVPIKSWCADVDARAMEQAAHLACHPAIFHHVALMPDCHVGYGMPIGGVIAGRDTVIPNAVGVDIGCGMGAVKTSLSVSGVSRRPLRAVVTRVKERVPCGEGRAHKKATFWKELKNGWTIAMSEDGSPTTSRIWPAETWEPLGAEIILSKSRPAMTAGCG